MRLPACTADPLTPKLLWRQTKLTVSMRSLHTSDQYLEQFGDQVSAAPWRNQAQRLFLELSGLSRLSAIWDTRVNLLLQTVVWLAYSGIRINCERDANTCTMALANFHKQVDFTSQCYEEYWSLAGDRIWSSVWEASGWHWWTGQPVRSGVSFSL